MINTPSSINFSDAEKLTAMFKAEFKALSKPEQNFIKQVRHKLTKQQGGEIIDF
jgi:hypothetical protein